MRISLDPTPENLTILQIGEKTLQFPHAKRDSGASLIRKLASLKISSQDELAVVVGPGNFTAIRTVCLIGNAIHFLTDCRLLAKKKSDLGFHQVSSLAPFYDRPAAITLPKK